MGRKVGTKRKISNDCLRRKRTPKNIILIAVEDNNKTEKIYFNNFENMQSNYSITYARGNDTDPLKLVHMLIKEIKKLDLDLTNGDLAYCIFDTDMDPNKNFVIKEATKLASENNITVITSAPCIELWFLLHFEYTTANMTNADIIKRLKSFYPKYKKNQNIYLDISHNVNDAIKRAKKLEKYQKDNNRIIGTVEANPNTEIYKVVETLI